MLKLSVFNSIFLFIVFGLSAQQRTVLVEEFTNASCEACAFHNPSFDLLLSNNLNKVIPLKYRTSFPGFDPMNTHNQSEVQDRIDYYDVEGVPLALFDSEYTPETGLLNTGSPSSANQELIDSVAAISSPFNLDITHSFDSNYDNILINVNIKNVSGSMINSLQSGSMKLRLALVEEQINFPIAPGTNGEKKFIYTMRDMIPNANGTILPDTWIDDAMEFKSFNIPMPDYIYSVGQIGVVAFIQDDGNKEIHQAAYSEIVDISDLPDAAIQSNFGNIIHCTPDISPSVNIQNTSNVDISSFDLSAREVGGQVTNLNWTGSLEPGTDIDISMGDINMANNESQIIVELTSINGIPFDTDATNNFVNQDIRIVDETKTLPYSIGFEQDMSAPSQYIIPGLAWGERVRILGSQFSTSFGGFSNSNYSLNFDLSTALKNKESNYITSRIDFSDREMVSLKFSHAYLSQLDDSNDALDVLYSNDCGITWNNIFSKKGSDLIADTTASGSLSWVENNIDISEVDGESDVIFWFKVTNDGGVNIYLDDIIFEGNEITSDVDDIEKLVYDFNVTPNPLGNIASVSFYLNEVSDVHFSITDLTGRTVLNKRLEFSSVGTQNFEYDTADLGSGIYFFSIQADDNIKTIKLVK